MSQTVSIRLNEEVLLELDSLSKITDRSRAWLMGHAVEQYVKHEAWQVKAIEKTLSKVQQGEGKFVSHEAVSEWLHTWGTSNEENAPICK